MQAQPVRADDTFYLKFGGGLSDYAGGNDGTATLNPTPDIAEFFDTRKFSEGPFPYALAGEMGYQFSPELGIGLGYQFGQYPFASGRPFTVRDDLTGVGGDHGTIRHTIQLLGRYMIGAENWTVSPYLDTGLNVSLGGYTTAVGPVYGAGLDVSLSGRTSLFLETRINVTFPDEATDGIDSDRPFDALSALPTLGLKYTFKRPPVPPRVIALNGPEEVRAGESASFRARVNEEDATRPLTYRWEFGDGRTASGITTSHVYNRPGTFDVTFTARNEDGAARDSLSVTVLPPPQPARILSVNATPNPVEEGELVRFDSDVEGASPVALEWDFGDGNADTGPSPTHTYDEPGQYPVHLLASNEDGRDRDSLIVQVERVRPEICETVQEFNTVYFAPESSQLSGEATQKLGENVDVLSKCPTLSVRIEGFASRNEQNAQVLSKNRAQAVANFYEAEEISPDRIERSGEGPVGEVGGKKGGDPQHRRADSLPQRDD